ncbi:hypothetical protein [Hufsiella ginkgonis]|uniref:Uncharacterized protein n=1 Tax=Hufsiella ginkgonis TaxID=2695274 RepID=A0A7K1Y230_9SPHI|nr:hypothetical protein [Hufsiella ginkgonis]MXV17333.1 hypothetical protein [Hufsiella ginkgonis]
MKNRWIMLMILVLGAGNTYATERESDEESTAKISSRIIALSAEIDLLTRHGHLTLQDTVPDSDDVRKLKALRASIREMILDIDHRIARIDSARARETDDKGSLAEKLFGGIKSSFTERKLTWLRDIRDFLYTEQERLDGITKGVSSISSKVIQAKLKVAAKLKGIL